MYKKLCNTDQGAFVLSYNTDYFFMLSVAIINEGNTEFHYNFHNVSCIIMRNTRSAIKWQCIRALVITTVKIKQKSII